MEMIMDSPRFYELKREKEEEIAQRRWDYSMYKAKKILKPIGSLKHLIEEMSDQDQEDFKDEIKSMIFE